jgi:hypothetical protein
MLLQVHKDLPELQVTRETQEQEALLDYKVHKALEELKVLQGQVLAVHKAHKVHKDFQELMGSDHKDQ